MSKHPSKNSSDLSNNSNPKDAVSEKKEITISGHADLTKGSIWKHIFRIAIPAMLGQIFNILYSWTDTYWGGKISTEALAAFSLTFPPFLLAMALGQCFASGGMILVSNAMGAKNVKEAQYFMKQTVLSSLWAGIGILGIILLFGREMLILLGARDLVLTYSLDYLYVLAFGMPFLLLFFSINIGLTSQGNTKFMRNVLIMNAIINMGLDPLFLYGLKIGGVTLVPAMGIKGIALATVLVQVLGVILAWKKIQENDLTKWESKFSILPEFDAVKKILHLGLPTFLQIGMTSIGLAMVNFFLVRLSVGTALGNGVAVAGYGIGLRIEQLALVPTLGIGMALSALVGQNNGAKNYLRVREVFIKAIICSLVLWLATMLPITLTSRSLAKIFTNDYKTIQVIYFYLFFAFVAFMAYQLIGASSGLLQGMKKPKYPMIFLTARQLVLPWIFIPLFAYYLKWHIYGVFTSVIISVWISAIILTIIANLEVGRLIKNSKTEGDLKNNSENKAPDLVQPVFIDEKSTEPTP